MHGAARTIRQALSAALAVAAMFGPLAHALAQETPDERFLEALRGRGMYDVAAAYAERRWRDPQVPDAQRVLLAVEAARTYTEQALVSAPGDREPLWRAAEKTLTESQLALAESPRLVLLQLQAGLTWLARGELGREEAPPGDGPELEAAREALRNAASGLETTADRVGELLRETRLGRRTPQGALAEWELAGLERNIGYQSARVYRNQALCYPPQSADRVNSLSQALEKIRPVARLPVADRLVWRSRIEEAIALRLLGNLTAAQQAITGLAEAAKDEPWAALVGRAEQIRLLIDAGQVDQAIQLADQFGRQPPDPSTDPTMSAAAGELDLARLEATIAAAAAARQARNNTRAAELAKSAAQEVQTIQARHGPYWHRRAELLLARSVTGAVGSSDVDALVAAAVGLYRGGQFNESIATYDRATSLAASAGDDNQVAELAQTAAAIAVEQGQFAQASRRYAALARRLGTSSRAPAVHLLAITAAAEAIRAAEPGGRDQALADYEMLLAEHIESWPDAPTAGQALLWQGKLHQSRSEWPEAIAALCSVKESSPQYAAAIAALVNCYDAYLSKLQRDDQPTDEIGRNAAEFFDDIVRKQVRSRGPAGGTTSSPLAVDAAMAAATIWMQYTDDRFAEAGKSLETALAGADGLSAESVAQAQGLLLVALSGQRRLGDAMLVVDRSAAAPLDRQVEMLDALVRIALPEEYDVRQGALALRVVRRVEPQAARLSATQRRVFAQSRAAALALSGDVARALAEYEQLAQQFPNDGQVQEAIAAILARSADPDVLRRALAKAREIERRSPPPSPLWFRARMLEVETLLHLGEADEAAKLIELTRVLHPDLGGAEDAARFDELLQEARGR